MLIKHFSNIKGYQFNRLDEDEIFSKPNITSIIIQTESTQLLFLLYLLE